MATDETQARIIDAAGQIFAAKGYRATTIREICEAAGVGLASVNYHFHDKQQLYVTVVDHAFAYWKEIRQTLPESPPGTPAADRLRHWIRRLAIDVMVRRGESWQERLLTKEVRFPTPECEDVLRARMRPEVDALRDILAELLGSDTPAIKLWLVAYSILGQCLFYDSHREVIRLIRVEEAMGIEDDCETVAAHVTDTCLAAFGLAPPIVGPQPEPE